MNIRRLVIAAVAVSILTPAVFAIKNKSIPKTPLNPVVSTVADPTNQPVINQAIQEGLNPQVAKLALEAYNKAEAEGKSNSNIFTIIDYSMPSDKKRMWVVDLKNQKILFNNLVAHAKNSGSLYATQFSNKDGSHKTSLGLYVTKGTYTGHKGLSLRMQGLEKGINDHAMERAIVVHGAKYANPDFVKKVGRLGRSWGCPAVPENLVKPIIGTIKGGSLMFLYGNDNNYLSHSDYVG